MVRSPLSICVEVRNSFSALLSTEAIPLHDSPCTTDFRAIQRILDKFSDAGQQILVPCVQHAIAFLNGLLSR